jgi:Family of unknown function (DUF6461)
MNPTAEDWTWFTKSCPLDSLHTEATPALAEHLTGVRLTQEFLDNSDDLCGLAPLNH